MSEEIKVSIVTLAYNQEKYIAQALDSFISQITDFKYEIIVHDDCSTDRTAQIIREYEKKYPQLIKAYYEETNQYSQGVDVFGTCLKYAKGEYIAMCEGDDFWIDNDKLQIQYNIMQKHPEVDMCATSANELCDELIVQQIRPKSKDGILNISDVILGGGRYIATATLFYRKKMFDNLMNFEKILSFDYSIQIKGALRGGIYYIDRVTAIYRRATEGSWTKRIEQNKEKREKHIAIEKEMLRQLDSDTNFKYHDSIGRRLEAYTPFIEQLNSHSKEIISELNQCVGKIYLWGLGMRGDAIQEFFKEHCLDLNGVCDKKNLSIGKLTIYQNQIMSTEYVLENSDIILASNDIICDSLIKQGYKGKIINMQKYMALS